MLTMVRVTADICYLDGPLAGVPIPAGYSVHLPAGDAAYYRVLAWISRTRAAGDFVRATVTGHRYQFTSAPEVSP